MRKLATVRTILDIQPIPGADAIECATVDGWKVVAKKGDFQVGQLATYYEIDSWIPQTVAPFLCKDGREFNGVIGARLRTVKLRGQISQGLLLPAPEAANDGDDLTEALGIQKYEAPMSAQLSGIARGVFPSFIPKTDQERIQNLRAELVEWAKSEIEWEVTEKLDGSSMTAYIMQGEFGVCSRNLDLLESEGNSFWRSARANDMENILRATGRNIALQGELIGPSIQGNAYQLNQHEFHLFDIYDIDAGRYMTSDERLEFVAGTNIRHVPVLPRQNLIGSDITSLLARSEGKSYLHAGVEREGVVFKCVNSDLSFKVISNKFLLNEK